jgi:hypothetical protein
MRFIEACPFADSLVQTSQCHSVYDRWFSSHFERVVEFVRKLQDDRPELLPWIDFDENDPGIWCAHDMQARAELRISAPSLLDVHKAIQRLESRDEITERGRLLHRLPKDFIDSIVVEANAAGRSIAWIRVTDLTE